MVIMQRIILMVLRLILKVPYYMLGIWWCGRTKNYDLNRSYAFIKKAATAANRAGKVTIESYGVENLPKKDGFVFFPNHQGLYDGLAFLESCPRPFSFVIKKEAGNVILLKQIISALRAMVMDRQDIKQSLHVINQVADEVKKGRNFLIFPEGTRSRLGNKLLAFKGGTFKCAMKAKCPIVPCALIDSFIPFDQKGTKPVTVKLFYLEPIYYEEYKSMRSTAIADMVKARIEAAIAEYENR